MEVNREQVLTDTTEFGYYVEIAGRRWRMVLIPALVLGLVAILVVLLTPERFTANAVIVEVRLPVGGDVGEKKEEPLDLTPFAGLVYNPELAQSVLNRLESDLEPRDRNTEALLSIVKARVSPTGSEIQIEAAYTDAHVAGALADAWARESIERVNAVYSQYLDKSLLMVRNELDYARSRYKESQSSLEAARGQDRRAELRRRTEELSGIAAAYGEARQRRAATVIEQLQRTDLLLQAASGLADQLADGGEGAAQSSSAALQALKLEAFGTAALAETRNVQSSSATVKPADDAPKLGGATTQVVTLPGQSQQATYQLQAAAIQLSSADMVRDIVSLISVLEERKSALLEELQIASVAVTETGSWPMLSGSSRVGQASLLDLAGDGEATPERRLEQSLRDMVAEQERHDGLVTRALIERDLALDNLSSLMDEEAQLLLLQETGGLDLRLAVASSVSTARREIFQPAALAGASGLVFGLALAFGAEYWQGYLKRRGLSQRKAQ